jgi:peptidoglycan/xylan/chitin deacetylase (PgdA/CDA1 family)
MNYKLTIVMYHYVRPIATSKYPGIKGLELESFKNQLDYLEENYSIINSNELIDSILKKKNLPPNACWLTFDDGYKDHFKYVLPELLKRKLSAAFFPPKKAITESKMLDVNSIHHILSCQKSIKKLVFDLHDLCLEHGLSHDQIKLFYSKYAVANRWDNADTIYIKRMLQYVLPEEIRNSITSNLFYKYINVSESDFAKKLYMNIDEVSYLIKKGMYVGSHSCMHYWLDQINEDEQRLEISKSLQFLEQVKAPTSDWIMCYPYGAYNKKTLSILKEFNASIGITTEPRVALINKDNPLTLPRLDTNDFPQ